MRAKEQFHMFRQLNSDVFLLMSADMELFGAMRSASQVMGYGKMAGNGATSCEVLPPARKTSGENMDIANQDT